MRSLWKVRSKFDRQWATFSCQRYNAYTIREHDTSFKLTHRETECLFLFIRGKSANEIGKFLAISPRTVEVYIENIKEKMGVSSRNEIIDKAIDFGFLEIIPRKTIYGFDEKSRKMA